VPGARTATNDVVVTSTPTLSMTDERESNHGDRHRSNRFFMVYRSVGRSSSIGRDGVTGGRDGSGRWCHIDDSTFYRARGL